MNKRFYFLGANWRESCRRRRPWWQHVFFHGYATRDDIVMDWMFRKYEPDDGLMRHPLKVQRNLFLIPEIWAVESTWVVSERLADAIASTGSRSEFLQVQFEKSYAIEWSLDGMAIDDPDAEDDDIKRRISSASARAAPPSGKYFEWILPYWRKHKVELPGAPALRIFGQLGDTRTVSIKDSVDASLEPTVVNRFKAIRFDANLIIDEDLHRVIAPHLHPVFLAIDPLQSETQ
jgi:hypothetical protein